MIPREYEIIALMGFPHIFLIPWFLISMSLVWIKEYRHTLFANIGLCASFAVYAWLIGQHVAATIPVIAASTSVFQLLMPLSEDKKQVMIRNGVAVFSAVIACALLYQKPSDIFPCLGFTVIRIGEARQSARIMKAGFFTGMGFWIIFGLLEELYLLVSGEIIIVATFLYRTWRIKKLREIGEDSST